jgi:outer membrane protein
MKNLSAVLNVVLVIAVAALYYMHFKSSVREDMPASPTVPRGASIVFVNTDSLLDSYTYFKDKREEFDKKSEQVKSDLTAEGERLQSEAAQYQEQARNMTAEERAKKEDELMTKQQKLMKRKESLLGGLEDQQSKFHDTLYSKLYDFLKKNNKSRNYAFVLGYSKGGGILFANDSLDITRQMVEGLNKEDKK